MRATIVDAYDSFSHIIYQYLCEAGATTAVLRSGPSVPLQLRVDPPDLIVLGPGPGHPASSGHVEIVQEFKSVVPIFGVCLGHQAIALAFGGTVERARHLMHGKTSAIHHDSRGALRRQPRPFQATRYHSLVVGDKVPGELVVTARDEDDHHVMGLRHRSFPIESVQFHPESIGTADGMLIFKTFLGETVRPHLGMSA